jgi:ATP-dependent 26S proteasome regulatory subunit
MAGPYCLDPNCEDCKKQKAIEELKASLTGSTINTKTASAMWADVFGGPTFEEKGVQPVGVNAAEMLKKGIAAESMEEVHQCASWLAEHDAHAHVTLTTMIAKRKIQQAKKLLEMEQKLQAISQPPLAIATYMREIASSCVELEGCNGSSINPVENLASPEGPVYTGDKVLVAEGGMVVGFHSKPNLAGCSQGIVLELKGKHAILEAPGESDKVIAHMRDDVEIEVGDEVLFSTKPNVVVAKFEHKKEQKWMVENPEKVLWSEIGGLDGMIKQIRRDLDIHLLHRAKVKKFDIRPMTGITLHGAPGVGKTMTAKAIAYYLSQKHKNTQFLNVAPGSLRGWLYGQTEHRIRELFQAARDCPGYCIIFFDELDNFGSRSDSMESGIDSRVLATLLSELDGMGSEKEKILVVGATNRMDLCDQALVRPGRFGDRVYEVPRPDEGAAKMILKKYLPTKLPMDGATQATLVETVLGVLFDPKAKVLALHTVKQQKYEVGAQALVSGAMLESIAQTMKHTAAHRFLEKGGKAGITLGDAMEAASDAVRQECQKLTKPHAAQHALGEPDGQQIASVEIL